MPQSGSTAPFYDLRAAIVPGDVGSLPHGLGINQHLTEFGQAFPFDAWATILTWLTCRRWSAQTGVLA